MRSSATVKRQENWPTIDKLKMIKNTKQHTRALSDSHSNNWFINFQTIFVRTLLWLSLFQFLFSSSESIKKNFFTSWAPWGWKRTENLIFVLYFLHRFATAIERKLFEAYALLRCVFRLCRMCSCKCALETATALFNYVSQLPPLNYELEADCVYLKIIFASCAGIFLRHL